MLTSQLSKVFQDCLAKEAFFGDWAREKPREYWRRGKDLNTGIDLQLSKWWEKAGGEVAVNLWCGHRWTVPTMGWVDGGMTYSSTRLSPTPNGDHWWQINSAADVNRFDADFSGLLVGHAISWFEQVSRKEGFLNWYSSVFPGASAFPYILEIHGPSALTRKVCEWLAFAPRGIDREIDWLVGVNIISEDLSRRVKLASMQAIGLYSERLPQLIEEIEPNLGGLPRVRSEPQG